MKKKIGLERDYSKKDTLISSSNTINSIVTPRRGDKKEIDYTLKSVNSILSASTSNQSSKMVPRNYKLPGFHSDGKDFNSDQKINRRNELETIEEKSDTGDRIIKRKVNKKKLKLQNNIGKIVLDNSLSSSQGNISRGSISSRNDSSKDLININNQERGANSFRKSSTFKPRKNRKYFKYIAYAVYFFCLCKKVVEDNNKLARLNTLKRFNYHYDLDEIIEKTTNWMYNTIKIPFLSIIKSPDINFDISNDDKIGNITSVSDEMNDRFIKLEVS